MTEHIMSQHNITFSGSAGACRKAAKVRNCSSDSPDQGHYCYYYHYYYYHPDNIFPHSCHKYFSNVWGGREGLVASPRTALAYHLPSLPPYPLFIINTLPLSQPPRKVFRSLLFFVSVSSRRFSMFFINCTQSQAVPGLFLVCVSSRRFSMFF